MELSGLSGGTTGEFIQQGNIRTDMFEQLLIADLVIADISIHNANVFYELGIRHALRDKRTFLIKSRDSDSKDEVPFDLKNDRYLSYDPKNPGTAVDILAGALKATLDAQKADSPVYQLLPGLEPAGPDKVIVVPLDFREEVCRKAGLQQHRAETGPLRLYSPTAMTEVEYDARSGKIYDERGQVAYTVSILRDLTALRLDGEYLLDGFVQTVHRFNAAVQPGSFNPAVKDGKGTRGISPPKSNWAQPLDTPPYVGFAVTTGITFTFGGLRITGAGQVLDAESRPIPGLFAAGELVGGLFYQNYPGGAGLMAGLDWFLNRTFVGKALRATAHDAPVARLMGVHVTRLVTLAFVLSAVVAGIGGVLVAPITFASIDLALLLGLKGFIAVVIGEGGSGGALALGVADRVLMLENAIYSVISPEGCAAILWKDASQKERAAEALKLTARDLLRLQVIDQIVPEPAGGAHADPEQAARSLGDALDAAVRSLEKLSPEKLRRQRAEKFRRMGKFAET